LKGVGNEEAWIVAIEMGSVLFNDTLKLFSLASVVDE
jgi:hypothetical protein